MNIRLMIRSNLLQFRMHMAGISSSRKMTRITVAPCSLSFLINAPLLLIAMGVNNSVMRCVNDAGDRESDLITMRNLRVRNKDKRELQFGNRVVYLSPHIDSGDGSSSYFSPLARAAPAGNSKDDRNYLSSLPIASTRYQLVKQFKKNRRTVTLLP